jgi:PhnB protein
MQIHPYLIFNGQCKEAFTFYEQVLGGKIAGLYTYGDTPASEHVDKASHDRIMHTRLEVGDAVLMGSDSPAGMGEAKQCSYVSLHPETVAEAERIFKELSEGGEIRMPIGETFWSARFAMFVDRFGTPWMINCEKAD